jgi:hypothetical protein
VLALEAEMEQLKAELAQAHREAAVAVDAAHREHRRDLVPLSQAVVRFGSRLR